MAKKVKRTEFMWALWCADTGYQCEMHVTRWTARRARSHRPYAKFRVIRVRITEVKP